MKERLKKSIEKSSQVTTKIREEEGLTPSDPFYVCDFCDDIIHSDIVRIDNDKIYHLDCFERHMHPDLKILDTWACPKCKTTGKYWSTSKSKWKVCKLCHGNGYLTEEMTKQL